MNLTFDVLKRVSLAMKAEAECHPAGTSEAETFLDAHDSVEDAIELLQELGDL